jgi:predicted ribosomally synthesized peptide with nif11-like leader
MGGAKLWAHAPIRAMSEEQLSALLTKLKEDSALREQLQGAEDLDTAVEMAKVAGFDVGKADWLKYLEQTLVSEEELEGVAGGAEIPTWASFAGACETVVLC